MIECIEEFRDELNSKSLRENCILLESNIPEVGTGTGKRVPGRISINVIWNAHLSPCGRRKACRIKELCDSAAVRPPIAKIRIADFVG
jgi:hypothetical protein